MYTKKIPGSNEFRIDLKDYSNKVSRFNKVIIVNTITGEELIANSLLDASRLTELNHKTIARNIDTGKVVKGFILRALNQ